MRLDAHAQARRLLERLDQAFLADLAEDPFTTIPVLFEDVTITKRPPSPQGRCDIDGSYHPGPPPRITLADDVPLSRQRFTALHELGHHLIWHDVELNELSVADADRPDEAICNEVAATVLLPTELVDEYLQPGAFTARDVATFFQGREIASRAACCVAAVRRLHHHGCVMLGSLEGTADFIAHQLGTPWRIARGTPQGEGSLLVAAARNGHARGITRVRFASGKVSGEVHGDAFDAGDGWIFMVVVADPYSPWEKGLRFATIEDRAPVDVVECPRCDHSFTASWAPCRECGDVKCPQCHKCGCVQRAPERMCGGCGLLKAENLFRAGGDTCVDCCT
ncbi:MAG: ImmA/IrrE family metallo-endopeptidase [Actinomycetota bacterium]|nr:ImmA/IrrE family metallo-endopeptidase [Actinomycetota bacterium]